MLFEEFCKRSDEIDDDLSFLDDCPRARRIINDSRCCPWHEKLRGINSLAYEWIFRDMFAQTREARCARRRKRSRYAGYTWNCRFRPYTAINTPISFRVSLEMRSVLRNFDFESHRDDRKRIRNARDEDSAFELRMRLLGRKDLN